MKKACLRVAIACAVLHGTAKAVLFTGSAVGTWDSSSVVEQGNGEWAINNLDTDSGGNAKVQWGVKNGNYKSALRFDGAGSDDQNPVWEGESDGDIFYVGDLFYHNGVQNAGTGIKSIDLDVQFDILTPDGIDLGVFSFDTHIKNTTNPNGDTVSGLDSDTPPVTFDYQDCTYMFELMGFGDQPDGPYTSSLYLPEGDSTTVNLYAKITTLECHNPDTSVPDGGSCAVLLGSAFLALSLIHGGLRLRKAWRMV